MCKPKVSVIIPAYNVEKYIKCCIASVLAQTYHNLEIICVDNNSSDGTYERLESLQKDNPQILLLQEKKQGASAARNTGLKIATGEWIQFLDADDLLLPEKIEHQLSLILKEDLDFIAGASVRISPDKSEKTTLSLFDKDKYKALFVGKMGITSANFWRKDALDQISGWNENAASSQEADLMFRLLKNDAKVLFDKTENTIIQQRFSGQISTKFPVENLLRYLKLRYEIVAFLKEKRTEYFKENADFYYQFLFDKIRELAGFDIGRACFELKNNIPDSFQVGSSAATSKKYLCIYDIFGFKAAEFTARLFHIFS
jgi:glycosyltransferase involved in cell wall biosynthesis